MNAMVGMLFFATIQAGEQAVNAPEGLCLPWAAVIGIGSAVAGVVGWLALRVDRKDKDLTACYKARINHSDQINKHLEQIALAIVKSQGGGE